MPNQKPPKRGNTISFALVAVAFAIFVLVQWTNGDFGNIGNLLGGSAASPTAAATESAQVEDNNSDNNSADKSADEDNNTPVAAAATQSPTKAPANATSTKAAPTATATPRASPTPNSPPNERASDLPTIAYDELPPEAHDTIALIEAGGPFPYSRDGITFQNRERILPQEPEGYYREYTVITPGESDRGARRIVTGEDGEMYYTDDHYDSFSEIVR